jgi:aspartyl-tRNA(Asn)/glutamyl-tRNA(Gln) amidotransferase subunit A
MWESMMQTREQGFGPEVKRRIIIGTYALSSGYYDAYYLKAQKVRTVIKQEFDEVFGRHDLLLTPTTTAPAFRIGEKVDDPLSMYLNDVCTIPVNIAGIPALALPGGFAGDLPIGIQLMGPALSEELLLRAGDAYQRVTAWHTRRPALESTTR